MPYTTAGVYYPDDTANMSISEITQNVADSINNKLGFTQVKVVSTKTVVTNSSGTAYGNSGLTATITPKSVNNKIIVLVHLPFQTSTTVGYWSGADFILKRNGTQIITASPGIYNINDGVNGSPILYSSALSLSHTDNPASPLEQTYTVQGKMWNITPTPSAQTLSMNYSDGAAQSTLTLLEVAS